METNVNLQDMITIVNIIDVCSERGAFKGNELAVVGQLREKIAAFVKANQPQTDQPQTEQKTENAGSAE